MNLLIGNRKVTWTAAREGTSAQDYFGIVLENPQNLEREGDMKGINSVSWWCLNTTVGWGGVGRAEMGAGG